MAQSTVDPEGEEPEPSITDTRLEPIGPALRHDLEGTLVDLSWVFLGRTLREVRGPAGTMTHTFRTDVYLLPHKRMLAGIMVRGGSSSPVQVFYIYSTRWLSETKNHCWVALAMDYLANECVDRMQKEGQKTDLMDLLRGAAKDPSTNSGDAPKGPE